MQGKRQENGYAKTAEYNMNRLAMPLLILHLLSDSPMYAYQLDRSLEKVTKGMLDNSCLSTLEKLIQDGCVVKNTQTIDQAHKDRPYYSITADGRELLEMMKKEFKKASKAINTFIKSAEAQREKEQ